MDGFSFDDFSHAHGLIYPTGILVIAETIERRDLAFANSIYLTGWDVGNALGSLVSAPFATGYGTKTTLIVALLSPIIGLLIILLLFGNRTNKTAKVWKRLPSLCLEL